MIKAASTYVYVRQRLHPGLLDGLKRAGAGAVEIFCARGHFDYTDRSHVREIASWITDSGVALNSLHSPMFSDYEWGRNGEPPVNLVERNKTRRVEAMDEIKRALEVAETLPFRFLVQHLGTTGEDFDGHKFEAALSSIEHLHAFAKPLGVKILIENIPNEISTPEHISELIQALHYNDIGVCFDFGHANVMSSVAEAFSTLRALIRSTHIHDNGGEKDDHLWPGEGSIKWDEAMALLHEAPHVPPMLLEINGEGREKIVEGFSAAFEKLEKAAVSNR